MMHKLLIIALTSGLLLGCGKAPTAVATISNIRGHWVSDALDLDGLQLRIVPDMDIDETSISLTVNGERQTIPISSFVFKNEEIDVNIQKNVTLTFYVTEGDKIYLRFPATGTRIFYHRGVAKSAVP
jgi:uncharacterized lipoprotein YajG